MLIWTQKIEGETILIMSLGGFCQNLVPEITLNETLPNSILVSLLEIFTEEANVNTLSLPTTQIPRSLYITRTTLGKVNC